MVETRIPTGVDPNTRFQRRWHTPNDIFPAAEKVYISDSELESLIREQLGSKLSEEFKLYAGDEKYFCPPIEDAREIMTKSALDRKKWVEERFDCDDFAIILKAHFAEAAYLDGQRRSAHCFGVVWGLLPIPHAINWMVNADLKLRFVEPQDNQIFLPRENDKGIYFMLV